MKNWTNSDRWVVVATGGVCAPCAHEIREYLPRRWRPEFEAWWRRDSLAAPMIGRPSDMTQAQAGACRLDRGGLAAEVLSIARPPDWRQSTVMGAELDLADVVRQAHNRWLADFCAAQPTRRVGTARVTLTEPTRTADEIRSLARSGLRAISIACDTPAEFKLLDCDAVWQACVDTDMPVKLESGVATLRTMTWAGTFVRFPRLRAILAGADLRAAETALRASDCTAEVAELDGIERAADELLRRTAAHRLAWSATTPRPDAHSALRQHAQFVTADSQLRLRMFFGANAAETYGLSLRALAAIAQSIGPALSSARPPSDDPRRCALGGDSRRER